MFGGPLKLMKYSSNVQRSLLYHSWGDCATMELGVNVAGSHPQHLSVGKWCKHKRREVTSNRTSSFRRGGAR